VRFNVGASVNAAAAGEVRVFRDCFSDYSGAVTALTLHPHKEPKRCAELHFSLTVKDRGRRNVCRPIL
jgi:hypothetical protein